MGRIRAYRTEAIVLSRTDYGEADRILTLFTPDHGKVRAIARGARRLTSRTGSHIELFHHIQVVLAEGRNLEVLTQAEAVSSRHRIRDNLLLATYAYHMVELVDRLTVEGQGSQPLFALLRDGLIVLENCADPTLLTRYFELRVLDLLGYRPELFACASCGAPLEPEGNAYEPAEGGVLCPDCRHGRPLLDPAAFRALRFLLQNEWSEAARLNLSPDTHMALERVLVATLRHILEREMKSVEFLANLRAVGPPPSLIPAATDLPVPATDAGA